MDKEIKRMFRSFLPGLVFVAALWVVKLIEILSGHSLAEYGVLPRTMSGLKGVITSPFIHGDLKHLVSNSLPMLVLGAGLFYFYKSLAYRVFFGIYLLGGIWLWMGGRESYHIGASGLIYGLTSFLFFSGVFRREIRLMALSMLVVFLYGGMVWGLFPIFIGMSWEAHLFGAFAGLLLAYVYRREGPQRRVYQWEEETEDEIQEENAYWMLPEQRKPPAIPPDENHQNNKPLNIHYIYRPKDTPPPDEKN